MAHKGSALIASTDIREYFRDSVMEAVRRQQVAAEADTIYYIVNLLTEFARAERLFEGTPGGTGLKPLAFLYGEALEADDGEARHRALKRLGDLALFISGMYADSLKRKVIDIDYYIAMGGNAYSYLSDVCRGPMVPRAHAVVFAELAAKFTDFVDVLAEVGDQSPLSSDTDILRQYEIWLRTGSQRAARKLAELGIHPSEGSASRALH